MKLLHLQIEELVGNNKGSKDFILKSYFKAKMLFLKRNQGWQTIWGLTPKLMKWMHCVKKQLGFN